MILIKLLLNHTLFSSLKENSEGKELESLQSNKPIIAWFCWYCRFNISQCSLSIFCLISLKALICYLITDNKRKEGSLKSNQKKKKKHTLAKQQLLFTYLYIHIYICVYDAFPLWEKNTLTNYQKTTLPHYWFLLLISCSAVTIRSLFNPRYVTLHAGNMIYCTTESIVVVKSLSAAGC